MLTRCGTRPYHASLVVFGPKGRSLLVNLDPCQSATVPPPIIWLGFSVPAFTLNYYSISRPNRRARPASFYFLIFNYYLFLLFSDFFFLFFFFLFRLLFPPLNLPFFPPHFAHSSRFLAIWKSGCIASSAAASCLAVRNNLLG